MKYKSDLRKWLQAVNRKYPDSISAQIDVNSYNLSDQGSLGKINNFFANIYASNIKAAQIIFTEEQEPMVRQLLEENDYIDIYGPDVYFDNSKKMFTLLLRE
jgi:hypothetical protein